MVEITKFAGQTGVFLALAVSLFLASFGLSGLVITLLSGVMFLVGGLFVLLMHGWERSEELLKEFDSLNARTSPGIARLLKRKEKKKGKGKEREERLTGSSLLDPILEEIVSYVLRDFVEAWYCGLTNDEEMIDAIRLSAHKTISILSSRLRRVDWVTLVTQDIVDDFASHIRLFRKATERIEKGEEGDLETIFFDLELEMEKNYCRDLVSTSKLYENAYLHDVADILMYLLIPPEDFRSRPFRLLLREIIVGKILMPIMDQLSDPDYVNHTIIWLLSEVHLNPDDFLAMVEVSKSPEELNSVRESIDQEINNQRAQDTGYNDTMIKSQLNSLKYLKNAVKTQMTRLNNGEDLNISLDDEKLSSEEKKLYELSLPVILANSISISYFMDYLGTVGGTSYIDLFLAIEGFKVSAEHQLSGAHLRKVTNGESVDPEVLETIREAALSLYKQYLSDEAKEGVKLEKDIVKNLETRIQVEQPNDAWFDEVQKKVFNILRDDLRFYPAFRRNPLYFRMLADLDYFRTEPNFECSSSVACSSGFSEEDENCKNWADYEVPLHHAHITTIGMGREGNHAFALYNIQVRRENEKGETVETWNVLRRYSDFHTLHATIENRFQHLAGLTFPGKKTFNNLNHDFLEKRKKALNSYMRTLLMPSILKKNPGLEEIVKNFLCSKDYIPEKGPISKKVMSIVNPIQKGVKAFGTAVTTVPDTLVDGVAKMGDGIGKVTKSVLGEEAEASHLLDTRFLSTFLPYRWLENPLLSPLVDKAVASTNSLTASRKASDLYYSFVPVSGGGVGGRGEDVILSPEGRVGAGLGAEGGDNIPLRIMLLLLDEVFGLRQRNQWFRRRLVQFLRQLIHAAFGSSMNKRIVDFVAWMTREEQVAAYLIAFRNGFWPGGVFTEPLPPRPHGVQMKTRMAAKVKMLAALPDELRLFMGNETSRRGIILVFEALQNPHLNRRLCYVLLERLLLSVFPDNRFQSILPKLHSKSPRCQNQT